MAIPSAVRPSLFLVVDTEEEFDWNAPLSPACTSVTAISRLGRLQRIAEPYGVKPTYVIDYPVATKPRSCEVLRDLLARDVCTVGAHLHPWINPPLVEKVCPANSYGCNLDPALERRKIFVLKEAIAEGVGVDARVYKAGRYGFGPSTARTLEALDFDVDMSVNPRMDFSRDGGPSFLGYDARPFTFGDRRALLEIPCSTGFTGMARRAGDVLHRFAESRAGMALHLPGILARLGIVNKVMLSPEGFTIDEMIALATRMHHEGLRTFSLSLHSPSLVAGHTPYTRTEADVRALLGAIDRFLDFFFTRLGGVAATPLEFHRTVCAPV